jgi:hypothetical protein
MGVFSFTAGVGVGVIVGVNAANRFRRAVTPATYAKRAGETAASTVNRIADAVADGRAAAKARETELGGTYLR